MASQENTLVASAVLNGQQGLSTPERWIQFVLQQGPVGTMLAGGAVALSRGLFPVFEVREAAFGSLLLLVGASIELFVWVFQHRAAERAVERAQKDLDTALVRAAAAEEEARKRLEGPFPSTGLVPNQLSVGVPGASH